MRKAVFLICGAGVLYAIVELASFLILSHFHKTDVNAFAASVTKYYSRLDDDDLREFLAGPYDPVLGWDNQPSSSKTQKNCLGQEWTISYDADGARAMPESFDRTLLAAYGDSYIRGGDINDDQAWTYQLARQIGMGAKNFGVGAYGTYQALLKAKSHLSQGKVYPVTVLGVNEENIRRVRNLFRPFLSQRGQMKFAFKPGLYCEDGQCRAIANPLRPDVHTVKEVMQIAEHARQWDYWALRKPSYEFPWSWNLIRLVQLAQNRGRANDKEPLWGERDGKAAMLWILAEFRSAVTKAGSIPVVLFFPQRPKNGVAPSYTQFKQEAMAQFPDLMILDVADMEFDARRFKLKPHACHPSEYGHSIIAETVRRGLSEVIAANRAAPADEDTTVGETAAAPLSEPEATR